MALTCQDTIESVEVTTPNEGGRYNNLQSPAEQGYLLERITKETQEWSKQEVAVRHLILEENSATNEFDYDNYYLAIQSVEEKDISPNDFKMLIHHLMIQDNFQPEDLWIQAKTNAAQIFAQRYVEQEKGKKKPLEEQIPKEFHEYLSVFSKEAAAQFPEHKPWDHKINLKPDFQLKAQKEFSLPQDEVKLTEEFVKKNLEKDTFNHPSLLSLHHSSLLIRRMEESDYAKTTSI